ncbi:hypothetical protein EE612_005396 [Oryza sativa]|nr:hypothetical protein EE612_005396 [Oryza sativa]KAB8083262.1 hypothetical protein EE612_005396 [Oryza sativa]KAB8083263.1 hypothetical protein EE612_005396 [Oryza sativa]KAB8083264.1 hypothetical protein EE612_005396 [Oryza sativa]
MAACGAAAAEYSALLSLSCGPITRRRFAVSCRARPPGNLSAQQKKKRGKNIAPKTALFKCKTLAYY